AFFAAELDRPAR
ncbi:transposase, partial [Mycobacterium tuberculosis TB_RSA31]